MKAISRIRAQRLLFLAQFEILHRLTPRPHVTVFVWKRRFFLQIGHTYSVETVTENASFQKRSPEWRFLKTLATRLRVDRRKRSFSNTMMHWIHHLLLTFRSSVQRFRMDGRKRFEYATCGRVFFCKTEEKISVSKVSGCVSPRLKMVFSEIFVEAHYLTYREATCGMCGVKLGEVLCSLLSCRNWNWKPV